MTVPFIRNEAPGYCVLISTFQFIKALNMSCTEFLNSLLPTVCTKAPKEMADPRFQKLWDDIYKGKVKYQELQRIFFKKDATGFELYEMLDPWTEAIYKIQCGIDIDKAEDATHNFDQANHKWDNKKIMLFYETFKDKCKEVPFFVHFCNFLNKKFEYPDHIYVTTMQDDVKGKFRIRAYNSDNPQGVVEEVLSDPVCPLIYGWARGYPDYGQLPEYYEIKPGGRSIN